MSAQHGWSRYWQVVAAFLGVWLGLRVLFGFLFPFLLGGLLAALSQPMIKLLQRKLHLPGGAAGFLSVTTVLAALLGISGLLMTLTVREAATLAGDLSGLASRLTEGLSAARGWAVTLASHAPAGLSEPLSRAAGDLFRSGSGLLERAAGFLLDLAGRMAERLPDGLIALGTAILSAYLIAPRLPRFLERVTAAPSWQRRWHPALLRLRSNAGGWLRAQLKLSGINFLIVLAGLLILGVENVLPLALLTAVVDAVPLLGTGTVLLPWALFSALTGEPVRSVGLLGIYVTAMVTRSGLEPRLLGRQLGLDPLAALAALYAGYRIWGFGGMILAPILTVTVRELARSGE